MEYVKNVYTILSEHMYFLNIVSDLGVILKSPYIQPLDLHLILKRFRFLRIIILVCHALSYLDYLNFVHTKIRLISQKKFKNGLNQTSNGYLLNLFFLNFS